MATAIPVIIIAAVMVGCVSWLLGFKSHEVGPVAATLGVRALPLGGALSLLLKDLCAYLFWIARNPITDMPPVPFMPGKP